MGQSIQCLETWADGNHFVIDYVYIHNPVLLKDPQTGAFFSSALGDLSVSQGYADLVYQNEAVSIYRLK
jgi:hypothetical protein